MKRREILSVGGKVTLAGSLLPAAEKLLAGPQNVPAGEGRSRVLHVYEDERGDSHLQELAITTKLRERFPEAQRVPTLGMLVREYPPSGVIDWHKAPARQFGITIAGELEVEVSGGVRRRIRAGELVFMEDTKGKGHLVRLKGKVTNLFVLVPDSFDVVAWAKGEA